MRIRLNESDLAEIIKQHLETKLLADLDEKCVEMYFEKQPKKDRCFNWGDYTNEFEIEIYIED